MSLLLPPDCSQSLISAFCVCVCFYFIVTEVMYQFTASLRFTYSIHADLLKQFLHCAFQQLKLFYINGFLSFRWLNIAAQLKWS